jgi:DNA-binding NarL/FixJ family response regulator
MVELLRDITELRPDVAIIDIALESSSGFDVMKMMAAMRSEAHPVVVVLSSFATQRYREEATRLGADYFFDKNGEILQLLKAVAAIAAARVRRNGWRH